jgi:hypothetical protein
MNVTIAWTLSSVKDTDRQQELSALWLPLSVQLPWSITIGSNMNSFPHVFASQVKVKVKVTLRLTVGQSVSLGVEPHLGLMTRYLLLFDSYGVVFVGRPLWRENGSVFCICCWPSPAQSFSGPSPWISPPYFTVSVLRLPFSSPPTTRRVTVEVFDPASTRQSEDANIYKTSVRTSQETHYVSATETVRLMSFGEIIAVYCENHTEHINTLCG